MSDFYTYRNEVAGKKRKRSLMLALLIVLAAACAGVGWFWMQRDAQPAEGEAAAAEPISTSESAEAESEAPVEAAAPAEPVSTGDGPARIVQAVDTAVWDTSTAVEQTIDTEYLNTDHRMVAVPMLGTVTPPTLIPSPSRATVSLQAWASTIPATKTPTMPPMSAQACRPSSITSA